MAEEEEVEVKVEPEDPEFVLEEHIAYKRKHEAISIQLRRLIHEGLADFRMIMDGSSFAYTKLALSNKGIVVVSELIAEYPHLRQLDLSTNQVEDITHIQKLRFLTHLNLSRNCIRDGNFLSNHALFPYVKTINLSNNKIKALPAVQLIRLTHLNLNNNEITGLEDFDGNPTLQTLELRGNKITSLQELSKASKLKNLYLADNSISSLKGISSLPELERLHLRKNKLSDLTEFPELPSLKYFNIRENQIAKLDVLNKICLSVKILNLLANPLSEELGDNTKKEVWMKYRQYERINKGDMTPEEKDEFDKECKERIAEQERQEREAKEQAQRQAAEAAEAAAADKANE